MFTEALFTIATHVNNLNVHKPEGIKKMWHIIDNRIILSHKRE